MRRAILFVVVLLASVGAHAQAIFFGSGSQYLYNPGFNVNLDDITTTTTSTAPGWETCIIGACGGGSPGGTGTPSVFAQTFNDTTHTLDGAATKVTFTDPANTNWLSTYKIFGNSANNLLVSTYSHFESSFNFYPDANAKTYVSEYEADQGFFSPLSVGSNTPNGTNYMFGTQCNAGTGVLQLWDQGTSGGWVNGTYNNGSSTVNIPCSVNGTAWNNEYVVGHIVLGDQTSCTSGSNTFPMDHYDIVCWNGSCYAPNNTNTCAGALTSGFASLVFQQVQADSTSGTSSNNANIWYDELYMLYY